MKVASLVFGGVATRCLPACWEVIHFLDDPTAKSIMTDLKITSEQAKDLSVSISSVKVQGIKPIQSVRS